MIDKQKPAGDKEMDDFVLPPFESTLILNDKVIKILSGQFKFDHFVILLVANVSECTEPLTRVPYGILKTCNAADSSEDFENVEEQPLDAGVPLPPDRLEAGGCEIESEEDAECSDNTEPSENLSPVNALLHKERKESTELQSSKQKKPRMVVPNGMGKDNQTKSGDAWSGTYFKEGPISSHNLPLLTEYVGKVGSQISSIGSKEVDTARIASQEKSDIYDVGVILLEIIVGKHINENDEVDIFRHQVRLKSIPIIGHPFGCSL
ncbi:hypothetical protein POM88_020101 [Heracleum sosnowskyi]|uniref:Protein kinase domain-containing protein n=1 Tax=Heracleum sosnowskyi TaxID=360622 RepID=A0AAD8MR54_9APIA|nr:hypothetical protein POM88_026087 [Heracleum sosnowskyi]KAK1382366.1 hypothetical protein POM88_020101 [Heracleum sosnowskyi]